jgi:hypothetical protein
MGMSDDFVGHATEGADLAAAGAAGRGGVVLPDFPGDGPEDGSRLLHQDQHL